MSKYIVTPDELNKLCKTLAQEIKEHGSCYDIIVPIVRGGLVPAQYIAYELDIKNIQPLNISLYNKKNILNLNTAAAVESTGKQLAAMSKQFRYEKGYMPSILFVDDLTDSGTTYKIVKENIRHYTCKWDFAVIYHSHEILNTNIIYAQKKPDAWVVFPWD